MGWRERILLRVVLTAPVFLWGATVSNHTYTSGQTVVVQDSTIDTSGAVIVSNNANVTFLASTKVTLKPGFTALTGSEFIAEIDTISAPTITSHPSSINVYVGVDSFFSVSASGAASYQWKKNGTNIGGATGSNYTITASQSSDAANYAVVVSNSGGSVTSDSASLTVSAIPTVTLSNYTFAIDSLPIIHASPSPTGYYKLRAKIFHSGTSGTHTHAAAQQNNHGAQIDTLGSLGPGVYWVQLYTVITDSGGGTITWGQQDLYQITITSGVPGDSDGDGVTNAQEALLGTNPSSVLQNDSNDHLHIDRPIE